MDVSELFNQKKNALYLRLERSPWASKDENFLSGLIYKKDGWGDGVQIRYSSISVPLNNL